MKAATHTRSWRFAAVSLTAALVLAACGDSDDAGDDPPDDVESAGTTTAPGTDDSPATDDTDPPESASRPLVMLSAEPSQGLDPNVAASDASRIPMAMIYETLVEQDENGVMTSSLAESWEISDDGLTYTFKLRGGIEFSDGSPITADDVVFSFERMQEGEIMSGLLALLTSVTAVDDSTIEMTLSAPSSSFIQTIGRPGSAAILSRAAVEADEDYFTIPTVTSGPWVLEEYVTKSHALLVPNPGYYNTPAVTLRYTFSEDQTAHAAAIQSGSADWASVGYPDAAPLKAAGITIVQSDRLTPLFWGWNRDEGPFTDVRVRQAVAYAVDRQGKLDACWFGAGGVTYGNVLRPWDPAYVEINTYQTGARDEAISTAAELLDEAGWVLDGDTRVAKGVEGIEDGTPFEIDVPYESNWPAAECHTQILQSNLAEVGISATPESYDPAAYWGDVADGKFTMYHGGAGAAGAVDLYANWFHSGGSLTALTTHLNDPEIDAMIDEALAADAETAKSIFQELEQWQAEELPMLVVGYQWPQLALSDAVQGYIAPLDQDSRSIVGVTLSDG